MAKNSYEILGIWITGVVGHLEFRNYVSIHLICDIIT